MRVPAQPPHSDTDHDLDKLIERTEVEGDEGNITSEPGLKFNFAKVWATGKDVLEDVGDVVPDIDHGDSWAQALERIAADRSATKEREVTGRGVRRKAAAAFPQVCPKDLYCIPWVIHILQQQLDFLDSLEETSSKVKGKGKKKGRSLKSGTSSDSDAYEGSAHHDVGDDTDATTESMDVDQELLLAPALPNEQPRNLSAPFSTTQSGSTLPPQGDQECGICGHPHKSGACIMVESSSNLLEYREILLSHTVDEPWEYRVRIDLISCERHVKETCTESRY